MVSYINQFTGNSQGVKTFMRRIWVPKLGEAQTLLLDDSYCTCYMVHPSRKKMYRNLKKMYWWLGMKRDVGRCIDNCLTCLQVNTNHQEPGWEVQSLPITNFTRTRFYLGFGWSFNQICLLYTHKTKLFSWSISWCLHQRSHQISRCTSFYWIRSR